MATPLYLSKPVLWGRMIAPAGDDGARSGGVSDDSGRGEQAAEALPTRGSGGGRHLDDLAASQGEGEILRAPAAGVDGLPVHEQTHARDVAEPQVEPAVGVQHLGRTRLEDPGEDLVPIGERSYPAALH